MRTRVHALVIPSDIGEFADDVRQIFRVLGRAFGDTLTGECSPPIDVHETADAIAITADLPGVDTNTVRIIVRGQAILIAGEKAPRRGRGDASFHLVERGYGRFARTVRLTRPFDSARATATLVNGELRITLPKVVERRGAPIQISISPIAG